MQRRYAFVGLVAFLALLGVVVLLVEMVITMGGGREAPVARPAGDASTGDSAGDATGDSAGDAR